jgi:hypothetical protein
MKKTIISAMMRSAIAALIVFVVSSFSGVSHAHAQSASIGGTVIESSSNDPMVGVTVELTSMKDSSRTVRNHTNKEGHFEIENLPAGMYKITFIRGGLEANVDEPIMLEEGEHARFDIELEIEMAYDEPIAMLMTEDLMAVG